MRFYFSIIFLSVLGFTGSLSAQYFDTGQDPSTVRWLQIKTGRFTVIYPENYKEGGIAFAKSLDDAHSELVKIFPEIKFRIPVVIHSYSTRSNGYVAWAPKRMEIYPTPEQNTIPLDPNKQLAVHELTHVFQMMSLNRGFSKAMSIPFGEQFTGITASLLPLWFLEGDAVFAETVLTSSGRGRSPSFQKELKAITVEKGGYYRYDKSLNGSYRDFVPDHYQYGYQMVTWVYAKYGPEIWNKVIKYTANQPFTLNPVNLSLYGNTGLTKKKLFNEAYDTLRSIWSNEISGNKAGIYKTLNPDKRGKYINYYSPVIAGTDRIIAIKTSLSEPPRFVMINPSTGKERKLHMPGQMYPWLISYGNGKLVWVETEADKRWENRDFSVIKILDLNSNRVRKLSRKTRYLAASVSPNGETISAIENTLSNKNNLVLIETHTGKILKSIPAPENVYLQRPRWTEDSRKITVIYLTEDKEGVYSYSITDGKWDLILKPGKDDLQSVFLRNDSLYYITSQSGTDNIFLKTPGEKIFGITSSRFGVSDLSVNGSKILFSDYTAAGNAICTSQITTSSAPVNITSSTFLINRPGIINPEEKNDQVTEYTPEPYRKWQHLFRFHSWMPFYGDLNEIKSDPTLIRPGLSFLTQNSLSTLTSTIGYEYSAEKNHVLHSRVIWKGWYPTIESQLDYGDESQIYKVGENVGDPSDTKAGYRFSNAISVPFRFSSGRLTEFLRPSFTSEYRNRYIYIKQDGAYDYGQTILTARLYFSNSRRAALRDIYPKWAQTLDLNYTFAPFDKRIYGTGISLKTGFYFPGILPNNGIKIRVEAEKQSPAIYLYGNRVAFPRGYKNIMSKELELVSVDYVMPLIYPDINIWSLIYIKRIRSGLFYDYASGTGNYYINNIVNGVPTNYFHNYRESFRSFGFELLADFHILRIPYMISGGIQTSWKNINEKPLIEVLFNIDLFGLTLGKRDL